MDFLTWGQDPWGQAILIRISWDLLWASAIAGGRFSWRTRYGWIDRRQYLAHHDPQRWVVPVEAPAPPAAAEGRQVAV